MTMISRTIADDLKPLHLPTAGAVVAELKFSFWQHLFVRSQDPRLWDRHLRTAFPAIPAHLTVAEARGQIHGRI